ncbi:MAG: glycerol acyltransferase [Gammaproteobacteria bacterium]|nr:glycerol acyltransferase [Gammaproteobacteria bacterium]MBC55189.1 glycerol acyltransferase [Gammaproteobacteria bacterium]
MRTTIFNTPLLTPLLRGISAGLLALMGWRAIGKPLQDQRFVLIGAPHTSNWDFPLMLMVVLKLELKPHWMGKHSLFMFPFGGLMRWLGGIPIDRRSHHGIVDQVAAQYQQNPQLVVLVPPEGTRKKVQAWKTGFYHIANNAGVPILMGYLDVSRKEAGLADFFYPTGDVDADIKKIRAFYATKRGIRPENAD